MPNMGRDGVAVDLDAHSNFDMSTWPVPTYFCWMCSQDRLMFMRSAAMATVRARRLWGGARAVAAGARRSFWPLAAFCPAESCRARGALASAVEAKGLYRGALKPVGLDAAGLGDAGG